MVLTKTDLVLVAPLVYIGKCLCEDGVARRGRVVGHVHLKRGPAAEGGGDIDRGTDARLRKGDGRVSGHGDLEERGYSRE